MLTRAMIRSTVLALGFVGCGGARETADGGEDSGLSTVTATASGTSGSATSSSASDTMEVLDVGNGSASMSGGDTNTQGCTKVDFLFVIDSSGSMEGEQTNLTTSFPGFIDAILAQTNANEFRILVTDTDQVANGAICAQLCALLPDCLGTPCNMIPPANPTPCDMTLGSGHLNDQNGVTCNIVGPTRWLTETQPDLQSTFACLARVGILGDGNEQQAGAAVGAVSPSNVGAGGCNEGFLRSDAILVVTVITDEEDGMDVADDDVNSMGTPPQWKQAIVDAKAGDEQAIVMLGLIGDSDLPNGICAPLDANTNAGAEPSPNLRSFITSFSRNAWASVCAPDYAPFFAQAISIIDSACDDFTPPG